MCWFQAAGLALSAFSAHSQMKRSNAALAESYAIEEENLRAEVVEADRLSAEQDRIESEQVSERIRAANAELGTLRVALGEMGATGRSYTALFREAAFAEGTDLARIRTNSRAQKAAIQADLHASTRAAKDRTTLSLQRTQAQNREALLSVGKSGLQLGTDVYRRHQERRSREIPRSSNRNPTGPP